MSPTVLIAPEAAPRFSGFGMDIIYLFPGEKKSPKQTPRIIMKHIVINIISSLRKIEDASEATPPKDYTVEDHRWRMYSV
jgi:hypothetical protein